MIVKQLLYLACFLSVSYTYSQVGINTQNPQGIFHVDGAKDNATSGTPTVAQQANDILITSSGNTGIGTIPTNKLHVKAPSNPIRLEGLINAQKTDSLLTVEASTGVVRMRSLSSLSGCNPNISAGIISHNQPYGCNNYDPGVFTSSAADPGLGGTVAYTWQQSTDGGATWVSASGTNNTQNYDPPALTTPTRYRRAAINYCGVVYSNTIDIAINGATTGIVATPCAVNQGGNTSLSAGLYTGSSVVNWSVSPSVGMSFSSTSTNTTMLTASTSAVVGDYTVTLTITSAACGTATYTKVIKVVPAAVSLNNLKRSCKEILDSGLSTGNGIYWIDPDGSGNAYCAEDVYCNMTDNGGGWTLILKSMSDKADFQYSSPLWTSGAVFNNTDYDITNASILNALYKPYNYLLDKDIWVDFITTPDLTPFSVPIAKTPKALATSTKNANISNQYLNQACQSSGMSSTYFSPSNAYSYQTGGVGNGVNMGALVAGVRFGVFSNNETAEIFNSADSYLGIGVLNPAVGNYGSGNIFQGSGGAFLIPCPPFTGTNGLGFYKALLWAR